MADVIADVAGVLATALSAETVREGHLQQQPDRGVWVTSAGGFSPVDELGTGYAFHRPRVRVFCRVSPRDRDELEALAQSAKAALHQSPPAGYTSCVVEGDITELAPDEMGRSVAVFSALLVIRE